jgi:hypothetical protein
LRFVLQNAFSCCPETSTLIGGGTASPDNRDCSQQAKSIDSETGLAAPADPELNSVMVDHLCLPPKEDADKLLRYEAMNDRQLSERASA